ncbi:MAG: FAD-dependent oxidoreductase [Bacteroidota bacterium]
MKRRNFIKTTAAGSAFLLAPGASTYGRFNSGIRRFGYQSKREIPVVYDVDVVVVGGSTAGVAAAVEASRAGAKVFLAAQEPYLGEDVSGTFRLWTDDKSILTTELGNAIWNEGLPTQLKVKKSLDNALIENHVDFLYSCYVTDILSDDAGNPAGVVMANRSGRQAIVAKTIIDATPRGMAARMAGVDFGTYPAGKQKFKFTVVGNELKTGEGISAEVKSEPVRFNLTNETGPAAKDHYQAIEYTLDIDMKDSSWASFAEAEQLARDLTWGAGQVESADLLFQNPPDKMVGQKSWDDALLDSEDIDLKVFRPQKIENLYVLSGSASLSPETADALLEPGKMIKVGERLGVEAAAVAKSLSAPENPRIKGKADGKIVSGDVGELLQGFRSAMNLGDVVAEETCLPVIGSYDVVVLGGGTAGAPAGVGAAQKGAKTLVVEYMHGMGGTGTFGMIGTYYYGYREGYTSVVDRAVQNFGGDHPRKMPEDRFWVFDWKIEYFRREIRKAGADIWFGAIGTGAYYENGVVKGIVVATPEGRGVILAKNVVDSTGSADVAVAAGAAYSYTGADSVAIQGSGLSHKNPNNYYNNTDWTFTDDGDMLDVWRTMVVAKDKHRGKYDIGKLPQTRERRRIVGDFTVSVLDVYNGRTYPDTISIHRSSFDTHGFTVDPFFSLKAPAHSGEVVTASVPFRALLPKGLEGIAVTGLGASAHRDAMPVIRMQACLQNQGYSVGRAAAIAASEGKKIGEIDIKALQKELVELGSLTENVLSDVDNYPPSTVAIETAAKTVVNDLEGLNTVLWDQEKGLKALTDQFNAAAKEEHKLVYARILGMYGLSDGWKELMKALDSYSEWDEGWNYTGMGQFGKSISYLDSLIIAAGRTKKSEVLPSVFRLMEKLTPESHFSHFRAVAIALETIKDHQGAIPLFKLLEMEGMRDHAMSNINAAKELTPESKTDVTTRNSALRELILARALYKCGDYKGVGTEILNEYSKDLRGHYYRHSSGVLKTLK